MAADRETRNTEGRMKRGNDSETTMNLTSLCAVKMRPNGERATVRIGPRKRGITTDTLTVLTVETNWARKTGRTWVTGRNASETR